MFCGWYPLSVSTGFEAAYSTRQGSVEGSEPCRVIPSPPPERNRAPLDTHHSELALSAIDPVSSAVKAESKFSSKSAEQVTSVAGGSVVWPAATVRLQTVWAPASATRPSCASEVT